MTPRLFRFAARIAIALAAFGRAAGGTDTWTTPYPSVRHLHRVTASQDYHVVLVGLADPHVSIAATRREDAFRTVSGFAGRYAAEIAINANYFAASSCGLAVGGGAPWTDAYADGCNMSIGFGASNEVQAFDSTNLLTGPVSAPIREVVTGKPWLVERGAASPLVAPPHMFVPNPRTALGYTADHATLVMLVVNGREGGAAGMTGPELANVLLEFGASEAVNLDGGGSSELFIANEGGVVNRPSDGMERVVANHLGIRIATGSLADAGRVDVLADASGVGSDAIDAPGADADTRDEAIIRPDAERSEVGGESAAVSGGACRCSAVGRGGNHAPYAIALGSIACLAWSRRRRDARRATAS